MVTTRRGSPGVLLMCKLAQTSVDLALRAARPFRLVIENLIITYQPFPALVQNVLIRVGCT